MHTNTKALVLAGGGAKGSYQVGVFRALQEVGWQPGIVTGTSVGSLNGAFAVMDRVDQAEQLWRTLDVHNVLEIPHSSRPEELRAFLLGVLRGGGLNIDPLGATIDDYVDEERMRTSPIRYGLVMTEMNTLKSHQYTLEEIPRGRLREYMMASSACFPALRPQEIDGVKYIDGGWSDNMPMDLAARMGATELLTVDIDGVGVNHPNRTGLPARTLHSTGTWAPCSTLTASGPPATCSWDIWTRCGCLAGWGAPPMPSCPRTTALPPILPPPTAPPWRMPPAARPPSG